MNAIIGSSMLRAFSGVGFLCTIAHLVIVVIGCTSARSAEPNSIDEPAITDEDRQHWAFQPLRRPNVAMADMPPGVSKELARNSIDLFVMAKLASHGLTLQPPAAPHVLARRLSFDLVGLPPQDTSLSSLSSLSMTDTQWRRSIDALLASPGYGERWAQHWLDLARFAETDGFEHDKVRKQAWRYRDWVVNAWNQGLPYDQFVRDQLAGDQQSEDRSVATMFCTSGPDMPDINSQIERKHGLLNEMTGAVGAVMMGLQIGCAQCHNHKYDPLSQADFFRLRALFEPALHVRRNESVGPLQQKEQTDPTRIWIRGDWRRPGAEVSASVPRVVNWHNTTADTRDAFARWLTQPDHPLTARVMVNRLWQHHMGRGLVSTPSDFGAIGEWPTHPALLDFLACELVDNGWNLQHVQRLILDSATYRQRSMLPNNLPMDSDERAAWQEMMKADPHNMLWSRFSRKRLDGEAVRDAMLATSGTLDRQMGGPGVRPPLPPELKQSLLKGQWSESPKSDHYRRSIYVFARRNLRYPIFEVLDRPDANASCPQRSRSTTAPQALLLLNSPLALDAANRLAQSLNSTDANDAVRTIFERCLSRSPSHEELALSVKFLKDHQKILSQENRDPGLGGVVELCLAIFNSNEFLYLD